MAASLILWFALVALLLGALSLIRPLRFMGIRTRRAGAALLAAGAACAVAVALWPAGTRRFAGTLAIERFLPAYEFHERHTMRVRASPESVYRAIREVTPREIRSLGFLMGIRSLPARIAGRTPREPPERPILDIATGSSFLYLADDPPREIVVGTAGRFWSASGGSLRVRTSEEFLTLKDPTVARAVMNFSVSEEEGGWSRVTTETRIAASSPSARRRFAAYWRLIYPGSSMIRYGWLRAIKRRTEAQR